MRRPLIVSIPLALVLAADIGHAGTQTHTQVGAEAVMPYDRPITIPRFDSARGILTAVRIEFRASIFHRFRIENLDPNGHAAVAASTSTALTLTPPAPLVPIQYASVASHGPALLGPYDGVIDFTGVSAVTWNAGLSDALIGVIDVPSAQLPLFVGGAGNPGFLQMPVTGFRTYELDNGYHTSVVEGPKLTPKLIVRYDYLDNAELCLGDGTQGACPCQNLGAAGRGCRNSLQFSSGARLSTSGTASIQSDSLVLSVSGLPLCQATFYQSTGRGNPAVLGDGLNCLAGSIRTLGTKVAASTASLGGPGAGRISSLGLVTLPGSTRFYQVHYTDPVASYCTPVGRNTTNMVRVVWTL
jgi:hypothetical protein